MGTPFVSDSSAVLSPACVIESTERLRSSSLRRFVDNEDIGRDGAKIAELDIVSLGEDDLHFGHPFHCGKDGLVDARHAIHKRSQRCIDEGPHRFSREKG